MTRSLAEQKANKCVHFNGVQHDQCDAGVSYDSVRPADGGLPCLRRLGMRKDGEHIPCEKRRWPTHAEVEEMVEKSKTSMQRCLFGLAAVAEDAEKRGLKKGNGGKGDCPCPVCDGGTIYYGVASYNGHQHARCTTDGCVSFME